MLEIVATRIRYGYRSVHVMLKREGWRVGGWPDDTFACDHLRSSTNLPSNISHYQR